MWIDNSRSVREICLAMISARVLCREPGEMPYQKKMRARARRCTNPPSQAAQFARVTPGALETHSLLMYRLTKIGTLTQHESSKARLGRRNCFSGDLVWSDRRGLR